MTFSFPKALETAAPSDRGVVPLRVPVAPNIIVVRYSVASTPSQDGNDGWARVRYTSCGPSPLFRQGHAGFKNLGGAYGLHSLFSSLRKFLQEPRGVLTVFTSPCPLRVVAHEQQRNERSLSWVTRNMLRVTKCL
jgi:hypothetical protein